MIPTLDIRDDLALVMPEIWLTIGMCAVILVPFIRRNSSGLIAGTAAFSLLMALFSVIATLNSGAYVFHNTLAIDHFSQFFKLLLIVFTLLIVLMWWVTSCKDVHPYDAPDFMCLLLGATLGMALMASASNLLTVLIAMEMASFPSFALAGFRKRHRIATEGSLKYVLFGAATSAVSIYGMSLIYGTTGSLDLGQIAHVAAHGLVVEGETIIPAGISPLLGVGLAAMLAGIAFKLSAVPLHFWCPDVFEGAPIEVTTFLSVASKGGAICLLVRVLGFFGAESASEQAASMLPLAVGVGIMGGITAFWGNLVALHQNNIKRLLAYSSIAHAGYMMMAASLMAIAPNGRPGSHALMSDHITSAILFYLLVYLFMNLGAFMVAAVIADREGTEDVRDYAGMLRRSPMMCLMMVVFLLSLFGMPGLGGFLGKIMLGTAMAKAGFGGLVLIIVLLINTLISFAYYVRPIYIMTFQSGDETRPTFLPRPAITAVLSVCTLAIVLTGIHLVGAIDLTRTFATIQGPPPLVQPVDEAASAAPVRLDDAAADGAE